MLLGEYVHTIDDKNRLTLPVKFRQSFAEGAVVTRGMDGCLYVYPRAEWARLADKIRSHDELTAEGRRMRRYFFSGAAEDRPDKQGRISVPAGLTEQKQIGREVVVAGVYDHLEIWDRAAWREEVKTVEGSAEDVAERLATRD